MENNYDNGVAFTTIINKYPTHRDLALKGCWRWLEGRQADDGAESLWRVHNKLYDLKKFMSSHPGGKSWILRTKGIDVTEAFEAYHISDKASKVLAKYYIREAVTARNYKLTFNENGFYRTLKRRVAEKMDTIDNSVLWKSKMILNLDLFLLFLTAIFAMRVGNIFVILPLLLASGLFLACLNSISHNFIHQKNNWQMYTANLSLIGWRDWRIFHGISHHLYPNSYTDLEISLLEPFGMWMPANEKSKLKVAMFSIGLTLFCTTIFHAAFFSRVYGLFVSKSQKLYWDEIIPLALPLAMLIFTNQPFVLITFIKVVIMWTFIISTGSFIYNFMAIAAGHHGPQIRHEGDEFEQLDFGIFQLGATVDRKEANSCLVMSLVSFGHHSFHHLFPALDHSLLPQLMDTFLETCKDFEVELQKFSYLDGVIAQYQQLSRTEIIKKRDGKPLQSVVIHM